MSISDRDIHQDDDLTIQLRDVYGEWSDDFTTLLNKGMIVAKYIGSNEDAKKGNMVAAHEENKKNFSGVCPVWGDTLQYKSCTIICEAEQEAEVEHWISYVEGGPPTLRKELDDGRIAFRADYQAW